MSTEITKEVTVEIYAEGGEKSIICKKSFVQGDAVPYHLSVEDGWYSEADLKELVKALNKLIRTQ